MLSKLQYRADIDGLRAVAVLSVLFYHAGMRLFSGGFVGVDVFFVISGYLITSIIINEIKANEFHLVNFYERRIRRIFPVLFAVVAFTLLCGALLYDAKNYTDVGNSAISATLFYSNIHFWSQSGYFEKVSTLRPLLHAWSLSVEEQFYIAFPILVLLIRRFLKSRFALSLTLAAVISFVLSVYKVQQDATSAFYLMQYRAWELLIGSILGLRIVPIKTNPVMRNIFSLTGITMILASVTLYSHETPFPGAAALVPVMGSALVIYSGQNGTSLIGKILSLNTFANYWLDSGCETG
jgi:peptidoglycan/LPS O-acetylase OafA/YrhL